jgi:hypothetical protein
MAAAAAPRGPTLTECCLCSISEALPRFCIRAGESPAAVEVRRLRRPLSCCAEPCSFCHNPQCLPPALQKRLLEHLMANRCAALRQLRGAEAASWASAAAALLSALSAGNASFAATLALTDAAGRGLLMLPACANLRALSLRGVATDAAIRAVAKCPQLSRLDCARSPALTATAAVALAAGACAPALAVLLVPHCAGVDDAFVASAAALPALRHLDVSDNTAVTDAALAHLLRRLPPLACLRVARCTGVRRPPSSGGCWAEALCRAMPGLTCLDAAGSQNIAQPAAEHSERTRAALAATPPTAEASALAALAARRLPPQQQLAERRALARSWGGSHVAALVTAAAEAEAGGKRRRDEPQAAWGGGAMSAARVAPWARAAPDGGSVQEDPWG